ncbi:hypothetical protein OPKNFCMD_3661 [Methylobacterium crusticola]|uniref:Uncharacterized protein n=1 Tax=Methylobacterium crusticola TaxID=1697972 RepID=A0ABQ4R0F4_9HYPH|nr:hypothetical protein [Methylobacterium crusticola]GJD50912.1 hypothetical protein OPKNFCMD_3661 [Methylobacterium crusticola]
MTRWLRHALVAALLLAGGPAGPAAAQRGACPPGFKSAAGACVRACPGGYEDRGAECVYRSESH